MIVIEIADDGHGIDVESVKKKAMTAESSIPEKNLTDVEAFSSYSGGFNNSVPDYQCVRRGVGLDVVRTHIEKLNGTVQIDSKANAGSGL